MQFYLNGFKPGNPELSEAAERGTEPPDLRRSRRPHRRLRSHRSDPRRATRCVPRHHNPHRRAEIQPPPGRPGRRYRLPHDGDVRGFWLCRSGHEGGVLGQRVCLLETRRERRALVRSNRIQDVEDGLSEFPHVVLNQARVHDFYLDVMCSSPTRLAPDYARRLLDLSIAFGCPGCACHRPSRTPRSRASGRGGNGQRPLCRRLRWRAQRRPRPWVSRCMATPPTRHGV